jgi:myo-inositol catabolism protein IolC
VLSMPVEKSGQNEFDFEHGEAFGEKIEEFDPDFSKVLVRYNPDGDGAMNERQTVGARPELGDWLHAHGRKFLFELLVPAEPAQLEIGRWRRRSLRRELRPGLMMDAIVGAARGRGGGGHLEDRGHRRHRGACRVIAQLVPHRRPRPRGVRRARPRRGRREGRRVAARRRAGSTGYIGFAIGRSIWWEPLKGYVEGKVPRQDTAASIARNYRRFVDVYEKG